MDSWRVRSCRVAAYAELVHSEPVGYAESVGTNGSQTRRRPLTALIQREGDGYVALCPELDIASQGDSVEQARQNLVEALELFFETADPSEVAKRMHAEVYVTQVEVAVG